MSDLRVWFGRGLRLSVVVGALAAGSDIWGSLSTYSQAVDESIRMQQLYECAAKVSDDIAAKHLNAFGNIDGKAIGCSVQQSWVAPHEIAQVRAGTMDFKTSLRPINWPSPLYAGLAGFVASMAVVIVLLGLARVWQWVWGRPGKGA